MKQPKLASTRLAVDVVIFTVVDDQLSVLLVRRPQAPFKGAAALPGGFMWEGETSLQTAQRILASKAGVSGVFMEQLYTFDDPARDPRDRVLSLTYYALVPSQQLVIDQDTATDAPFLVPVGQLDQLAFDHKTIIAYAVGRVRSKLMYTNTAYSLLPPKFTFSQLQTVYEVVLERQLDKRNFRKKFMSLNLIKPTNDVQTGTRYRPAQLYTFTKREVVELPSPAFG